MFNFELSLASRNDVAWLEFCRRLNLDFSFVPYTSLDLITSETENAGEQTVVLLREPTVA